MAYFPSFGPFYDPDTEQEVYGEQDGSLIVRNRPTSLSGGNGHLAESGNHRRNLKAESKWQDPGPSNQGDLSHVGVNRKTRGRSNSLPQQSPPQASPLQDRSSNLSRQDEGRHSDSAVPPPRLLRGSASEEDEEDKMRSSAELRRKSKQLQQALQKKQDRPKNGETKVESRYRKSKTSQSSPVLIQKNNSRLLLLQSHNIGNSDVLTPSPRTQLTKSVNGATSQQDCEQRAAPPVNGQQHKVIILVPDFSRHSDSSNTKVGGAELFELLLGIVLCRYTPRSGGPGSASGDMVVIDPRRERKVVVQGVVAGSPADKSGNINRGDMLLYLNGQEVAWSNLSSVIQNVKKEVKLTFQTPKIIGPTSCSAGSGNGAGSSRLSAYHNLCLLVTGHSVFSLQQQLLQHRCVALYLTFTTSAQEITPHDDIVYSFPSQEEPLTAIRGLFLTLSAALHDAVQSGANSSSLIVNGELVNAVYHRHGRDVFVLAASNSRVPMCLLRVVMVDTCRMLHTVFGDVDRAFHDGESGQLDQVFALLFHRLVNRQEAEGDDGYYSSGVESGAVDRWQRAVEGMCAAPLLQLSEENRLICDEILCEYESLDFDDFLEENELYARRSFMVLGTSLFYKNYLVCNHLHPSDLRDVQGFLRCHSLVTLAARQSIDQLVVWDEVHLHRRSDSTHTPTVGYLQPAARWFILITGMDQFMLVTLLEAGGCSQEATGRPGPPPLFVDQARATLAQLDTGDVHMLSCCRDKLSEDLESAQTTSVERFVTHGKLLKEEMAPLVKSPVTSKPPSPGRAASDNPFKYRSSPRPGADSETGSESAAMTRQGSKMSYGSNDSGGSGSSTGASKTKASRFSSLLDMSAIGRSMSALHLDTIGTQAALGKINRGRDNVLFHYIHCNDLEGILVTSPDLDLTLAPGNMHTEVMANFHRCVLYIQDIFQQAEVQKKQEKKSSSFECESVLTRGLKEYGVLFHCPGHNSLAGDRRPTSQLGYWVVGRQFSSDFARNSFYVCFHESSNQTLVEMAFALGFGT